MAIDLPMKCSGRKIPRLAHCLTKFRCAAFEWPVFPLLRSDMNQSDAANFVPLAPTAKKSKVLVGLIVLKNSKIPIMHFLAKFHRA
ncbi:hypothetical protein [uncultured Ruegeria sp.]|uniref:hypothetical protein n=1 Tax=uncultured Ruegeria sp. TaxID=259304 RepID=UPI00262ABE8F|nr:hypothetical protein [uncultured Ruegeria sp.]